jgi:hypothetical protein
MGRHLAPGGVLLVEPWFRPDGARPSRSHLLTAETEGLKAARMSHAAVTGRSMVLHFEYLIGTADGIERRSEEHRTTLFTEAEMRDAFARAGLAVEYDAHGLTGRGLYVATHPREGERPAG